MLIKTNKKIILASTSQIRQQLLTQHHIDFEVVKPFFDEYDSPAYFKWQIYPSFRTHGITSLYSTINDEFLICLTQAIIGSLVWIYLWFNFQILIKNRIIIILSSR